MTNNNLAQPPVVVQSGGPFLPAPRVARSPHPPSELVAGVVGAELAGPLVLLDAVIAEAEAAVAELEAGRPGGAGSRAGETWRDAVTTDAEAAAGGERPKRWRTETLLQGEPHRWAQAHTLAGAVALSLQRMTQTLNQRQIAAAAEVVEEEKTTEFAEAARRGWEDRSDKAHAWAMVRAAEAALEGFTPARQVREWAEGTAQVPDGEVRVPRVDHLPTDPVARGHWLALELFLTPATWLHFPEGVEYPEGSSELVERAFPESGERFIALRGVGVYSTDR